MHHPSAIYTEEGDTPFIATAVTGPVNFRFRENNQIRGRFEFAFIDDRESPVFTNGRFAAFVDLNSGEEGFPFSDLPVA